MNALFFFFFFFFFFLTFGGLVVWERWGGGEGHGNLHPHTFYPIQSIYIFVCMWWLKGQAGYPALCISSTDEGFICLFWSFTAQSTLFRLFLSRSIYITAFPG